MLVEQRAGILPGILRYKAEIAFTGAVVVGGGMLVSGGADFAESGRLGQEVSYLRTGWAQQLSPEQQAELATVATTEGVRVRLNATEDRGILMVRLYGEARGIYDDAGVMQRALVRAGVVLPNEMSVPDSSITLTAYQNDLTTFVNSRGGEGLAEQAKRTEVLGFSKIAFGGMMVVGGSIFLVSSAAVHLVPPLLRLAGKLLPGRRNRKPPAV